MKLTVKDFKKGQTAYVMLVNNAARYVSDGELPLKEVTIDSVGRKYVHAGTIKYQYDNTGFWDGGMKEYNEYSVDYVLFATKEQAEEAIERRRLIRDIRRTSLSRIECLSIDDLKILENILKKTRS